MILLRNDICLDIGWSHVVFFNIHLLSNHPMMPEHAQETLENCLVDCVLVFMNILSSQSCTITRGSTFNV